MNVRPTTLIALDAQHASAGFADQGVDPKMAAREADLAQEYFAELRKSLELEGVRVIDGFSGSIDDRCDHACAAGASLYLAGHMNAGGGSYGVVGVDYRASQDGLARFVAHHIAQQWPELLGIPNVRIVEARPDGNSSQQRLYSLIKRSACPALVLEPLFVDGPRKLLHTRNRPRTMRRIATGILAALQAAADQGRL